MITRLTHVTIYVKDQDEALQWYTEKLDFDKRNDDTSAPGFRWLTVAPKQQTELEIVLMTPGAYNSPEETERMMAQVGTQSHYVLATDDCRQTIEVLRSRGVRITIEPEDVQWGIQAAFADLYGNEFVLVQPAAGQ